MVPDGQGALDSNPFRGERLRLASCHSCASGNPDLGNARLATVLSSSSEACVVEGNVVADEGVGEGDEAPRDGDEGDLGRFSDGAQVEIGLS